MNRRRVARYSGIASLVALLSLVGTIGHADVPASVDAYEGHGYAAGVHVIFYTGTQTSFGTGFLDNRFPEAVVGQDVSPFSHAIASNYDTGPGGNALAVINPFGTNPITKQPTGNTTPTGGQYAVSSYPATAAEPASSHCCDTFIIGPAEPGTPNNGDTKIPAGSGDTTAGELTATANAFYNGTPGSLANPIFNNATAHATTLLNPDGSIDVNTHSHVGDAIFGPSSTPGTPPTLEIKNVDVTTHVRSTLAGNVLTEDLVAPVTVLANGNQIQVSDQPINIQPIPQALPQGTTVPGVGVGQSASTGLVTFQVFLQQPQRSDDGHGRGAVNATGIHVVVTVASVGGQAENRAEYILGDGQTDGFVLPSVAPPTNNNLSTVYSYLPPVTTTVTNSSTNVQTVPGPVQLRTRTVVVKKRSLPRYALADVTRPDLVMWFYLWEALIFATACVLVWYRRAIVAAERE
jgi:hypothetical protein